jgi:hypothetical protein
MAENPRRLTTVAEVATIISAIFSAISGFCSVAVLWMALRSSTETVTVARNYGAAMSHLLPLGIFLAFVAITTAIVNFLIWRKSHRESAIFSPLQLDILGLAKRMREFHAEIKPDWSNSQMMHGYAHRFKKDLADVMHRLGEAKIGVGFLQPYTQAITDPASIMSAARLLERLALQLNDTAVS